MKRAEKKQQGMWDILIPILLVIAVLPWIVRLAIYSCGYSQYDWYSTNDVLTDLYCYYKSYFLDVIGIFAGIILVFRLALYKEKTKNMKIYIPIGIYCVFVLLSTIFSVNTAASLQGNFESFESCLVLFAYSILSVYAYQIMEYERDYKIVWYAIIGISVFFLIVGGFQIFEHDLMDFSWVQRLLMDKEEFDIYAGEIEDAFTGNNVYLTLYNPNYAGIALNMLFAVIFIMCLTEKDKKKKIGYGILAAGVFVLIWFTYSRASLLAVIITVVLTVIFWRREGLAFGFAAGLILVIALIGVDASLDFKYLSRMIDKNNREPLESMVTDEKGIHICYEDENYLLYIENDSLVCTAESKETPLCVEEGEEMTLPMGEDTKAFFYGEKIYLYVAENTLTFIRENGTYYYETIHGKVTTMEPIERVDLHGLEYLGSARGYIWSRVLPLLKDYIFIGSGPDTFAEVFPQQDYAGKVVYSDRPDMVIEKGHNDYLTKWIQTGGISFICIVVFYFLFIKEGAGAYANKEKMHNRIGFGCYLACISYMFTGLFNDSTLQTSPLFWVFAGIALSSIIIEKEFSV
ncbi:MAG: O-antigen ligase family protein [Lachnospiraceae bacterium]|nr:O-antigen ligase family protein [Lachnospiraceae bacterium]